MTQIDRDQLASAILSRLEDGERLLVAIAGPPGAGKSTLAEGLRDALNKGGDGPSTIVPMDGFHLDNTILDQRNLRSRKGSPPTFDCAGFEMLLGRLKMSDDEIVIPVFDRMLDLARAGASVIQANHRILIIEGNYLLLDEAPWNRLHPLFDLTISLDVPFAELERRLIQRWLDHGHTLDEARTRALSNDIPNAQLVVTSSRPADYIVQTYS
ncbi:nucleoside/nucleotide kinase family protein [Phyllobacterium leguminum]|uniref:Phosphoribulokinase/uridine kinase family protein n=1 Tax=Phyllobacterium leguminum TaxID=314237 RepID=A0A318T980_9HYPH|nr:nucleoside/nucleotide kinase family protein [Phyllobacterium leguminum]PYE89329.1 phosphoribulokinase/uridine kinase family protein [Phyllobacterium leguminum]